jgi:hypothetical protein
MSFMMIRILQNFSAIALDVDAQSPETRPPASWATATGRKGFEKVWPKAHLTLFAHVSHSLMSFDLGRINIYREECG